MSDGNYDLFMKGLIPFLPIEGVIDQKIFDEVKKIKLERHPIYIFDKHVLLGEKIENYDELLKTIMCNIINVHLLPDKKGQKGGGRIERIKTCIRNYEGELVNLGIALLLIFVAIVNIIRIQNTSIIETQAYKQQLSNEKALVVIDNDKALMLPKLDLGPKVDEITQKITVGEFLQAALGFNKNLITEATLIVNYEIEKQIDSKKRQLRNNKIPEISRDIFNNFMITQGTDIRARDNELLDINNIQEIINQKINKLKPTSRIFAAYKFSLAATTGDLIDSIDNAIQKFKRTTTAELENQGADALFLAKAHLKNIFRDVSTSGYLIYSALAYLLTAYSYRQWRLYREGMNKKIEDQQGQIEDQQGQIEDQEATIAIIKTQISKYKKMLGIGMDDMGNLTRRNITRAQSDNLTDAERRAGHGQHLSLTNGGKRRKRRKTRRKKRRKTRRKSKKRKSKRRRRKRKKTRRKRR